MGSRAARRRRGGDGARRGRSGRRHSFKSPPVGRVMLYEDEEKSIPAVMYSSKAGLLDNRVPVAHEFDMEI